MAMPMQDPTGGQPAPQAKPEPKQIEAQLIQALQQIAKLAEQNGIDFQQLIMKVVGGGSPTPPSAPPMPSTGPGF